MKRLLLFLLLLPGLSQAQIEAKYAAGSVPVENGKVVFSQTIPLKGQSKNSIYANALQWANQRFIPEKDFQSRVLFSDSQSGQIACMGQQYLVFTDKALSLDRAIINYQLTIECSDYACDMKISGIRYLYNVGESKSFIPAEEQITDEYTINKKKNKLIKATGKFRVKTIDLVNDLFSDAAKALGASFNQPAPQTTVTTESVIPTQASETSVSSPKSDNQGTTLAGYKTISPDKIPGNIYKLLSENWMLITAGNDKGFNMMTASWGGLGHLYNKPVAFCFINPTRHTISFMENNDTYTLSFYTETYRDALNYCGTHSGKNEDKVQGSGLTPLTTPSGSKAFSEAWMIIECKKIVEQQFTPEAILSPEAKEKWGTDPHKMFIGEIINVWVK